MLASDNGTVMIDHVLLDVAGTSMVMSTGEVCEHCLEGILTFSYSVPFIFVQVWLLVINFCTEVVASVATPPLIPLIDCVILSTKTVSSVADEESFSFTEVSVGVPNDSSSTSSIIAPSVVTVIVDGPAAVTALPYCSG